MSDIVDAGQLEIATDEHDLGWGPLSALPGHPLVWVLIASELAVFGLALLGYAGAGLRLP
jgi:nitric oxide reductase NorE protein